MQMYKVNINQTDAVYFRHQVDAQQYATKYNTQCYKVSIRPHHTAMQGALYLIITGINKPITAASARALSGTTQAAAAN